MTSRVLRRPLLAVCVILTALTGLVMIGIGVGAVAANSQRFGWGVATWLFIYGTAQLAIAWFVTRGSSLALGLIVASSLLHACAVGSFLTTPDRSQFVGMLIVAPFVLATVVTSVLAVGRRELDKVKQQPSDASA